MDRLVIVSVRTVVEFGGGCVTFVVSIGFSLAHTSFFLRFGAVLNAMIKNYQSVLIRNSLKSLKRHLTKSEKRLFRF